MSPWRVLYRGSLESCNYDCPYCPFAKRRATDAERAQDAAELERFVRWAVDGTEPVAIMFTPWGEALTERRYQEAIVRLSHSESVERVVAQTNLSAGLSWLESAERSKVALWATYHPGETTLARFLRRCAELDALGVAHSVGVVGKREHLDAARALRAALPDDTYLWINAYKSEGPGYYDAATEAAYASIDPLFRQGLEPYRSFGEACFTGEDTFSVDGAGDVRRCHFVGEVLGNLYRDGLARLRDLRPCPNATCRCHIGYVHLKRTRGRAQYGPRILERIPTEAARRGGAADAGVDMGIFDWFKKRGSDDRSGEGSGAVSTATSSKSSGAVSSEASDAVSTAGSGGDGNDPVVWLARKIAEHRVPADLTGMSAVELHNPVSRLAEAAAGFSRGPHGWAFGMALGDIEPAALERLRGETGEALDGWERALEGAHGAMGLSLFAEAVDGSGVPCRGVIRHRLRRGTLDPSEPKIEELQEAGDLAQVSVDRVDGALAVRVDGGDFGAGAQGALDRALAEHGSELTTLTLGLFEEGDYSEVWRLLSHYGPLPKLRELYVDFEYPDEVEISWTHLGEVDPLWEAAPELRDLRLRGGEIGLTKPRHPKLEKLVVESGGIPRATVRALCSAVGSGAFPMLKTLSLWAGTPDYGGEATVEDFAGLWCDTPPSALTHLGLMNTVLSNALVEPLVAAPLARQLVELSFSLGTLTDEGARALVAGRSSFAALKVLDVSDCFLTSDAIADLKRAFDGVRVHSAGQKEPDEYDDEVWTYVSVSE